MIVDDEKLLDIAVRYLGGKDGKAPLITDDEREILLFALYVESLTKPGIMKKAITIALQDRPYHEGMR